MIATPQMALEAAAAMARAAGMAAHILGDAIEGEARDVGKVFAGIALQVAERGQPFAPPCVLLVGRRDHGDRARQRARRAQCGIPVVARHRARRPPAHSRARRRYGRRRWQEEIAGAAMAPDTLARAWALGLRPRDMLANNDAHSFFLRARRLGDHRPDAHQRERLSRHSHRRGLRRSPRLNRACGGYRSAG